MSGKSKYIEKIEKFGAKSSLRCATIYKSYDTLTKKEDKSVLEAAYFIISVHTLFLCVDVALIIVSKNSRHIFLLNIKLPPLSKHCLINGLTSTGFFAYFLYR